MVVVCNIWGALAFSATPLSKLPPNCVRILEGTVGIRLIKFGAVETVGGFSVVNGRSLLRGAPDEEKRVAGRSRRPGKSSMSTSSLSSRSTVVNGNRFVRNLPPVFPDALGSSLNSSIVCFSGLLLPPPETGTRFRVCLALFPVGTTRRRCRLAPIADPLPLLELPVVPLSLEGFENEPLEGSALWRSSTSVSSSSGTAPRTACEGPGKSSGTIGLPLTRDMIGGGVGDSLGEPRMNS